MKKILSIGVFLALFVALPALGAKKIPVGPAKPTPAPAKAATSAQEVSKARTSTFDRFARQVGLTDDQIEKLRNVVTKEQTETKAWRRDPYKKSQWATMTRAQRHEAQQEIHKSAIAEAATFLTPEQVEAWQQYRRQQARKAGADAEDAETAKSESGSETSVKKSDTQKSK